MKKQPAVVAQFKAKNRSVDNLKLRDRDPRDEGPLHPTSVSLPRWIIKRLDAMRGVSETNAKGRHSRNEVIREIIRRWIDDQDKAAQAKEPR